MLYSESTTPVAIENQETISDKEELVTHFSQKSDEAKAQFYKDCEEGISAEQSRQNLLNFVRQLWEK